MSQRGRILLAEAVGTAILVLGGPGTAILAPGVGQYGVAIAFGFSLLIAVYLIGHISGCHINPAVTLGMWLTGRTKKEDVLWYWGAQLVGAAIASGLIWAIVRTGENAAKVGAREALFTRASNGYAEHSPSGYELGSVMIAEVLFTAVLVLVVLGVTRASMPAGFAAIPIGFTLALVHIISIPIDNTSVNPARSFATAIFAESSAWEQIWVFLVFPLIGGLIGGLAWQALNGDKLSLPSGGSSSSWLSGFGKAPASSAPAKRAPAKKAGKR